MPTHRFNTPVPRQPLIFISSSGDLRDERESLARNLRQGIADLSLRIDPFRWEEETENGATIEPGAPIQKQIDAMVAGRVDLTLVMFGERIGQPLVGEPLQGTDTLLAEWQALGLCHPWPEDVSLQSQRLDSGSFPLTGTVYETLVALQMNAEAAAVGVATHDERNVRGMFVRIGYVADRSIDAGTLMDEIRFNGERYHVATAEGVAGSSQRVGSDQKYLRQKRALLNFIKALLKRGIGLLRFESATEMVRTLGRLAVRELRAAHYNTVLEAVFKPDLSAYTLNDPMPFPDRLDLRNRLTQELRKAGAAGKVLALIGKSGCGKSSLMQKGLLGSDTPVVPGAPCVVLHPAEINSRTEPRPIDRVLGLLASRLGREIGDLQGLRRNDGNYEDALGVLEMALVRYQTRLLLGIDQFEEIIDRAGQENRRMRERPASWWQVLRFIGAAARSEHIYVVATLEAQRRTLFGELGIEQACGLTLSRFNVDFDSRDVANFVLDAARYREITLDERVAEEIQEMVERHEKARNGLEGVAASSFLPLLSLWLHRMFRRFSDRRSVAGESIAKASFGQATDPITLADLKEAGVRMEVGTLLSELVEDAWEEAGSLHKSERIQFTDREASNAYVRSVEQYSLEANRFVKSLHGPEGFDWNRFIKFMRSNGVSVPGVFIEKIQTPDQTTLESFLGGLVAVDDRGNMRLTEMPRVNRFSHTSRLIEAHLKRRLLEHVAETDRIRFVHQAVVDNWPPAKQWYDANRELLGLARELRLKLGDRPNSTRIGLLAQDAVIVRAAAALLNLKRAIWDRANVDRLDAHDRDLRTAVIAVVAAAPDGSQEFDTANGKRPVISEAVRYDIVEPLSRWLDLKPELLDYQDEEGRTLLEKAAWFAPRALKLLLERHIDSKASNTHWHPIAAAIQSGELDGLRLLLQFYDGPEQVIGPNGITMLHAAACSPTPASLKLLLRRANGRDLRDAAGATPLHHAVYSRLTENTLLLLGGETELDGADFMLLDDQFRNVLHYAAWSNADDVIRVVLERASLKERTVLLHGSDGNKAARSPITEAAVHLNPDALAALLDGVSQTGFPSDSNATHPFLAVIDQATRPQAQPVADRIKACVDAFLSRDQVPEVVLIEAAKRNIHFSDVRHTLEKRLVLRGGDLSAVPAEKVIGWITGDRADIAIAALEKRLDVLNVSVEGMSGASRIARAARTEVLVHCLARGYGPASDAESFRLEIGLRVCSMQLGDVIRFSDARTPSTRLAFLFPGVDVRELHPVIARLVAEPDQPLYRKLLEMGGADRVRHLLHRVALLGHLELYQMLASGLKEPPPYDAYGRLPSEVAPPGCRAEFAAFEIPRIPFGAH